LLDRGAAIDGTGGWTPLEEALYWNSQAAIALLLDRGAAIQNLRLAAGLGRTDLIENYFNDDGSLKPEAGKISWPWGDLGTIAKSNHDADGKRTLSDLVNEWSQDQQGIVNNAFVYACMHGHIKAAKLLLEKGAQLDVVPGGFDYAGTGLHYAAFNGHRPMVEFLLDKGADRNVKDTKVYSTAAGWADYAGHTELRDLLQ
jgi:ankyrin repeat protein